MASSQPKCASPCRHGECARRGRPLTQTTLEVVKAGSVGQLVEQAPAVSAVTALVLQLMIAHHQGGVAMAQAGLDCTSNPEVATLARAIVTGQQAEIDQMRQLLVSRQTGS